MKKIIKLITVSATLAVLTACGGGGSSSPSANTVNLTGNAAKGILIGADVTAHEVLNGQMTIKAMASSKTGSDGSYTLAIAPTSNPVIIKVIANPGTKMKDESQVNTDGSFVEVTLTAPLEMRTFISTATENVSAQINMLTEQAIAFAAQTKNESGNLVGLTKESLLVGKQMAQQMAPAGTDPFADKPATKAEEMTALSVMMAGIVKAQRDDNTCELTCQISKLSQGISPVMSLDGAATISSAAQTALQTKRSELVIKAQTALASSPAATMAQSTTLTTVTFGAVSTVTYEATNGLDAFLTAMRDGFKAAKDELTSAKDDLNSKYNNVSLGSAEGISAVLGRITDECLTSQGFACSGTGWSQSGSTYTLTTTLANGNKVSANLSGSKGADNFDITLSGMTVKNSANKNLFAIDSIHLTATGTEDKMNIVFDASVKAYDQTSGSTKTATLTFAQTTLAYDYSTYNNTGKGTFSLKGSLTVEGNTGDKLVGTIEGNGVKLRSATPYYGYYDSDMFFNTGKVSLEAANNNTTLLSLSGNTNSTTANNPFTLYTKDNFEKYSNTIILKVTNNVSLTMTESLTSWDTLTKSMELSSGTSKLTLSGNWNTTNSWTDKAWCDWADGAVNTFRCASELSLKSAGNVYTASLKKSGSTVSGDIYKGEIKVGQIKNNIVTVNGKEVSLF